jgi:hypothetical protein
MSTTSTTKEDKRSMVASSVAASATRKRNGGFILGKPVVLWALTYLPTQFKRRSLIGKARQLASPRPWLYLWFCMDIITCQCASPEMAFFTF